MSGLEPLLTHALTWVLALSRTSGIFLLSPLISNKMAPRLARVLLCVSFTAAMYPTLPRASDFPEDLLSLAPLIVGEVVIGALIGLLASAPVIAAEVGGIICGHQMGFGISRVYSPTSDADSEVLAQVLMMLAVGAFVAVGGLEGVFVALRGTFDRVPMGAGGLTSLQADVLVGVLASALEVGLRVAMPVVCIVGLVMVALSFAGKTMPQINVMTVGFALKAVGGLLAIGAGIGVIHTVFEEQAIEAVSTAADLATPRVEE